MNAKGKDECGQDGVQTGSENRDGMSDLYAIGLQEVVDLNAVNVAIDTRSQARRGLFSSRGKKEGGGDSAGFERHGTYVIFALPCVFSLQDFLLHRAFVFR